MINNVALTGRLVREPEVKSTQSGISVMSNTIAVERKFKNSNGERETDFINIVAWRKTAETMGQYLNKGSLVGIEGNIQTRNYENNEGRIIYVTEVVIDNFSFLESRSESQQNNYNPQSNQGQRDRQQNDNPFAGANSDDPFESNGAEIDDSSLPF